MTKRILLLAAGLLLLGACSSPPAAEPPVASLSTAGSTSVSTTATTATTATAATATTYADATTYAEAEPKQRQPQPGLLQLNELLDEARDTSGTGARLIVRGAAAGLDPGVELAAYRIVQEALTNARRHAPGAAVDVELHYAGDTLALRIRDNGPGPSSLPPDGASGSASTGGLGLLGMRERAAAVGGELRTGPASGGGFLVETVLPTNSEAEPDR
jgi:two-component sensor histidine kinase